MKAQRLRASPCSSGLISQAGIDRGFLIMRPLRELCLTSGPWGDENNGTGRALLHRFPSRLRWLFPRLYIYRLEFLAHVMSLRTIDRDAGLCLDR